MFSRNRLQRYFKPELWVNETISALRDLERDPGEIELATFTFQTLKTAHICEDFDDWIVLTNRLLCDASLGEEVLVSRNVTQHFRRHEGIHRSFNNAIHPGSPRILNIKKLATESGASLEDVELFVRSIIKRGYLRGTEWLDDNNLKFEQMTWLEPGAIIDGGDKKYYPHAPLLNLYKPLEQCSESGAWGSVNKHRLLRTTVWADAGAEVALKIIPQKVLLRMLGGPDLETAEERVVREFLIGRCHDSSLLARSYDIFKVDIHGYDLKPTPHYGIVMDFINGKPLAKDVLSSMSIERRLRIAIALTRAVAEFHKYGVHRDIKPGNAILKDNTDSDVVLVDYGIAKGETDNTITDGNANFAALYAAPQQIDNPADEHRADDVYELGLSLAELLLVRKPFSDIPRVKVYDLKQRGPYCDNELEKIAPNIAKLVQRMTSPSRDDRPTVREVLDDLQNSMSEG